MIDHRSNLVFVRNPKTASRSLQVALCGPEGLQPWAHAHLEQYDHLTPAFYPPGILASYLVVTAVRHPIDRAISMWFYSQAKGALDQYETLQQWAEDGCPMPSYFKVEADACVNVIDQLPYIDQTDFVIRYEHIDKDFAKVAKLLALPESRLEKHNVTKQRPRDYTPDPPTLSALTDRFRIDMTALHYT